MTKWFPRTSIPSPTWSPSSRGSSGAAPPAPDGRPAIATAYTTVQAGLAADRQSVLDVWAKSRPHASDQRYDWIYGPGAPRAAALFILRAGGAQAVGTSALIPRLMQDRGAAREFGQAVDLVVDAAHRSVGPALTLQRAITESCGGLGIRAIYGFPNKRSAPLMLRGGYEAVGELHRWTRPLRSAYKIDAIVRPPFLARVAAAIVDVGLRALPANWAHRRPPGWVAEEVAVFDASFDRLWSESRLAESSIRGDRSAAYLTWRFVRCPHRSYRIFRARDGSGALAGYVVWYVSKGIGNIADLYARDEESIGGLIDLFVRHVRREEIAAVSFVYLGPPSIGRRLGAFGFFHRPEEAKIVVFRPKDLDKDESERLLRRESWYLTEADRDV